jgi:hypothetical protein
MTGLVRKAAVCAAILALAAPAAMAGVPSPGNSTIPSCVMLLPGVDDGYTNALISAYQPFSVHIRDVLSLDLDGVAVIIDVQDATDVKICDSQEAGTTIDCVTNTVRRTTAGGGLATFRVRGAGKNSLSGGGIGVGSMTLTRVFAGATLMKNIHATVPDENGGGDAGTVTNGVDAGDGSFFRYDLFNLAVTAGRSDMNCSGLVDPADGSALRDIQFNDATSAAPQTTTYCPN